MDWITFLSSAAVSAVLTALLGLLGAYLLERYKSSVEATMLRLRESVDRRLLEHDVGYRRIDQRKEEALVNVHGALYDLYDQVTTYCDDDVAFGGVDYEALSNDIIATNKAVRTHLFRNCLYIPIHLHGPAKDFYRTLTRAYRAKLSALSLEKKESGNETTSKILTQLDQRIETNMTEANEAFPRITDAYRKELHSVHSEQVKAASDLQSPAPPKP